LLTLAAASAGCNPAAPPGETDAADDSDEGSGTDSEEESSGSEEGSSSGESASESESSSSGSESDATTGEASDASSSESSSSTTSTEEEESESADSGGYPPTWETMKDIFRLAPCLGAGCHSGETQPELIDDAELHERVTSHVVEGCGGLTFVVPFEPENSAFPRIVRGECSDLPRMPLDCVDYCLSEEIIEIIEQWIADGALED